MVEAYSTRSSFMEMSLVARQEGMVTEKLVPTIVKGQNDDQVGKIIWLVAFTLAGSAIGRISPKNLRITGDIQAGLFPMFE